MALVLDGLLGFGLSADGSLKLYEASGNEWSTKPE